jgi:hypothetical protein
VLNITERAGVVMRCQLAEFVVLVMKVAQRRAAAAAPRESGDIVSAPAAELWHDALDREKLPYSDGV